MHVPHAPEFSLDVVRWLAWTTLALVLMTVSGLLLLRWLRWRSEPHKAAFRQRWSEVLMRCALGEGLEGELPHLKSKERWAFMKLWLHCQLSIKGSSRDRLAALARAMDCQSMAMRKLASRHAAERLMAILALGFLKDQQAQPVLLEQLQQGEQQAAVHAARALLEIDAFAHAAQVVQRLVVLANLDFSLVSVLLKPYRGTLDKTMMDLMPSPELVQKPSSEAPASASASALQWLRLARAMSLQVPGERLDAFFSRTDDVDVLIAAARLMQGEQGTQALIVHAQHKDWRVRAQVAQALGRIGSLTDVELLARMTTDAQWWVRYRATQALLSMPGLSAQKVQAWIEGTGDRYAINMLHSVISEREAFA